ncbi:hypothetical protein WP8W18C01_43180 [Pseudomonas putida]|uniref:Uncharacterized protein n=1 Tax=Pseudomonas putida TaxID=303 RepID=A0A6S5TR89_PSEPU|nr:hypothetical protein WP8W18C01_43180 [Pseudomonas putida]
MAEAANIHADLARNGPDDFLIQNFDFIKGLLAHASMGVGMASDAWSRHLESIKKTLQEIEKLYQDFLRDGRGNRRDRFYVKRADLFARLRQQLRFFASFGSGLRGDGSIKSRLGISTKSFLHTGEIPGYAEKVAGVVRASNLLKKGTYLAMTIEVGSTAASIYKACTLGREEECRKAKYVEGGALVGGMSGGVIGGWFTEWRHSMWCTWYLIRRNRGIGLFCTGRGDGRGLIRLGWQRGRWENRTASV